MQMTGVERVKSAIVGLLLVATVTACGDDSAGLSSEEFVERANELCVEADRQGSAAFESVTFAEPTNPSNDELQQLATSLLPSLREHRDALSDLGPPEGDESEFDDLIEALDQILDRVEEASEDPAAAADLAEPEFFEPIATAEEALGICPQDEE